MAGQLAIDDNDDMSVFVNDCCFNSWSGGCWHPSVYKQRTRSRLVRRLVRATQQQQQPIAALRAFGKGGFGRANVAVLTPTPRAYITVPALYFNDILTILHSALNGSNNICNKTHRDNTKQT